MCIAITRLHAGGALVDFSNALGSGAAPAAVDLRVTAWAVNPFAFATDAPPLAADVLSVELGDASVPGSASTLIPVSGLGTVRARTTNEPASATPGLCPAAHNCSFPLVVVLQLCTDLTRARLMARIMGYACPEKPCG